MKTIEHDWSVLTDPIQPGEIQWRVQSKRNGKTTVVPYLTNRCVMQRFDAAFGPAHWSNDFREWRGKGVLCTLSVEVEPDVWVSKRDAADETNIEPTKGGISDAMKRAAVQWGLGRDLYDYPRVQIEGEHSYVPGWAAKRLDRMAAAVISGDFTDDYVLLKNNK